MAADDERGGTGRAWSVRSLLVVAVVALTALAAVVWILGRGSAGGGSAEASGAPVTPTAAPGAPADPGPSAGRAPSPTPGAPATSPVPSQDPPASAPLPDLVVRFSGEGDIRSDSPVSADTLQDGAFFAVLHDADPDAGTVTVDIAIFLTGEEALEHLRSEDPARAEEGLDDGYLVVNEVERLRVLAVAPTARVGTWCFDGEVVIRERAFAEWASAGGIAATTACSEPARQANETYWLDVRDGVVAQITGQYLP